MSNVFSYSIVSVTDKSKDKRVGKWVDIKGVDDNIFFVNEVFTMEQIAKTIEEITFILANHEKVPYSQQFSKCEKSQILTAFYRVQEI